MRTNETVLKRLLVVGNHEFQRMSLWAACDVLR